MTNIINPFNLETVVYSGTSNGITGETVTGHSGYRESCDTQK